MQESITEQSARDSEEREGEERIKQEENEQRGVHEKSSNVSSRAGERG